MDICEIVPSARGDVAIKGCYTGRYFSVKIVEMPDTYFHITGQK